MKIILGQSYFRALDPKELKRNMPYPPLGSLYAATILKNLNHEVIFFDSMLCEEPAALTDQLKSAKPDLFILYDDEFNYLTKMCLSNMRHAAVEFIRTAKAFGIPSIIYSSDAMDYFQPYLNAGCDAVIYGEGEITLQEVVNSFAADTFAEKREEIDGIKFHNGIQVVTNRRRKLIQNLDSLPYPDYSITDIERYRNIWLNNHGYFSFNISTTRGCPFHCNWCAKPVYGQVYNSRSPLNVSNEIKIMREKYGVDHLWITDDIFGLKPGWVEEFSAQMKQQDNKIPFKCLSRPDLLLRGNTMEALASAGCESIWIGAESGSQKILDAMDKGTTVEQIYAASEKAVEHNIKISFFIQFGYAGEDWEDIKLTRKMIKDCLPDDLGISVSYPLPGTKFFEKVKEEMKVKTNWIDSDDLDIMFTGTYERTFYKLLHTFVHCEFRILKIIKTKKFFELPRLFLYLIKMLTLRIKISGFLKNGRTALSPKGA